MKCHGKGVLQWQTTHSLVLSTFVRLLGKKEEENTERRKQEEQRQKRMKFTVLIPTQWVCVTAHFITGHENRNGTVLLA